MSQSTDILIVTVNENEGKAVLNAFAGVTGSEGSTFDKGGEQTYHNLGTVNGQQVVMVQSEMGSIGLNASLQAVGEAVAVLNPAAVIMVGVAFGMKPDDQKIGQVLVASRIMNYEPQRVGIKDGIEVIKSRGSRVDVSPKLLSLLRATNLRRKTEDPKISFGLIISGEKLVDNPLLVEKLRTIEPEAIGGEMEGAGLYAACQKARVDWILVKAICDWGDGNKDSKTKEPDQQLAAKNSATFVVQALLSSNLIQPKQARFSHARTITGNTDRKAQVTITIRGNLSDFTENEVAAMVTLNARLAKVSEDEVEIVKIENGSIIITLKMPLSGAERLFAHWQEQPQDFSAHGVVDLKVEPWSENLSASRRELLKKLRRERAKLLRITGEPTVEILVMKYMSQKKFVSVPVLGFQLSKAFAMPVSNILINSILANLKKKKKLTSVGYGRGMAEWHVRAGVEGEKQK